MVRGTQPLLNSPLGGSGITDIVGLNEVTGDLVSSLVDFSQVWFCLTASIDSDVAPWMETAPGGRVDGTRQFAGEQEYLAVTLRWVWYRYG